jgi:hypothetical protein
MTEDAVADETERWYVVQVFRKWSSLTVLGIPLDGEAAAPGCIGFMPIFKDAASAEAFKADQEHPTAKVAAIVSADA